MHEKRVMSMILAVCLVCGLFPPQTAWAVEQSPPGTAESQASEEAVDRAAEAQTQPAPEAAAEQPAESDAPDEQPEADAAEAAAPDEQTEASPEGKLEKEEQTEKTETEMAPTVQADTGDTDELEDYDIYLANYFLNRSPYEHMVTNYQDPCSVYVRTGLEKGMGVTLALWRVGTFNLKSEFEHAEKESEYYETILFDLLYNNQSDDNENLIYENTVKDAKAVKASNWKAICDAGYEVLMNQPVTEENMKAVYDAANACSSISNIMKAAKISTDIVGYFNTGKELLV